MKTSTLNKAEMILMGFVKELDSKEELEQIIPVIQRAIGDKTPTDEIITQLFKYTQDGTIPVHAVTNTICGMKCLTVTLETPEDEDTYDLLSEDGVFSSVYNFDCPDCSELGYSYFAKQNGRLKRIA